MPGRRADLRASPDHGQNRPRTGAVCSDPDGGATCCTGVAFGSLPANRRSNPQVFPPPGGCFTPRGRFIPGAFSEGGLIEMASRPCLDCGTPSSGTRCGGCARARGRARDAIRGSSTERGYDHAHEQTRALLLPHAIGTPCPRCSEIMHADEPLDLGHSEGLRENKYSRGDRIEHARCNRGNK